MDSAVFAIISTVVWGAYDQPQPGYNQYQQTAPQYNQGMQPQYTQQMPLQYHQGIQPQYNQQVPLQYHQGIQPQYNQQIPPQYHPAMQHGYNQQVSPQYNPGMQQYPPQTPPMQPGAGCVPPVPGAMPEQPQIIAGKDAEIEFERILESASNQEIDTVEAGISGDPSTVEKQVNQGLYKFIWLDGATVTFWDQPGCTPMLQDMQVALIPNGPPASSGALDPPSSPHPPVDSGYQFPQYNQENYDQPGAGPGCVPPIPGGMPEQPQIIDGKDAEIEFERILESASNQDIDAVETGISGDPSTVEKQVNQGIYKFIWLDGATVTFWDQPGCTPMLQDMKVAPVRIAPPPNSVPPRPPPHRHIDSGYQPYRQVDSGPCAGLDPVSCDPEQERRAEVARCQAASNVGCDKCTETGTTCVWDLNKNICHSTQWLKPGAPYREQYGTAQLDSECPLNTQLKKPRNLQNQKLDQNFLYPLSSVHKEKENQSKNWSPFFVSSIVLGSIVFGVICGVVVSGILHQRKASDNDMYSSMASTTM